MEDFRKAFRPTLALLETSPEKVACVAVQSVSSARHVGTRHTDSRYISIVGKTGGPPTPKPTPPLEGHWESRLILARGHAHVRSIKGAMPLSARQKATAAAAYVTSRLSTCGGETASAIVAAPRHSAAASRNVESSKVSS